MSSLLGKKGWISTWLIAGLISAYLSIASSPEIVQFDTPIDLVLPSLYSFSIARQIGSGFSVRPFLMIYYEVVLSRLSIISLDGLETYLAIWTLLDVIVFCFFGSKRPVYQKTIHVTRSQH